MGLHACSNCITAYYVGWTGAYMRNMMCFIWGLLYRRYRGQTLEDSVTKIKIKLNQAVSGFWLTDLLCAKILIRTI